MEYDDTIPARHGAGQRPTLEMVAARAGVSRGTASRVLSGATNVSPQAVAAVRAAAADLHYRPNLAARSLVTGRTGLVGLIVNQDPHTIWADPFHQLITAGAHEALSETDSALVLAMGKHQSRIESLIDLATSRLDGVLVVRSPDDEELITALLDARVPCCFAGYPGDAFADRASSVSFANEEGARSAVAHLVDRGRRVVATITGPLNNSAPRQRLGGWRHELRERDLPARDDLVAGGDWGVASGYAAMNELIARRPDLDAVFCANDLMAIGAMRALKEQGRNVPTDVSVVGVGGILATDASPLLTSVFMDVQEAGRRMARLLLAQLSSPGQTTHDVLPMALEIRDSS